MYFELYKRYKKNEDLQMINRKYIINIILT